MKKINTIIVTFVIFITFLTPLNVLAKEKTNFKNINNIAKNNIQYNEEIPIDDEGNLLVSIVKVGIVCLVVTGIKHFVDKKKQG